METMKPTLELPYPPSANHYWRHVGCRTLISRGGRRYREAVAMILATLRTRPLEGRLDVQIVLFPPDRRVRDLDNAQKALLDALQLGGAFRDDGQIDRIEITRGRVVPGGRVVVSIRNLPDGWQPPACSPASLN